MLESPTPFPPTPALDTRPPSAKAGASLAIRGDLQAAIDRLEVVNAEVTDGVGLHHVLAVGEPRGKLSSFGPPGPRIETALGLAERSEKRGAEAAGLNAPAACFAIFRSRSLTSICSIEATTLAARPRNWSATLRVPFPMFSKNEVKSPAMGPPSCAPEGSRGRFQVFHALLRVLSRRDVVGVPRLLRGAGFGRGVSLEKWQALLQELVDFALGFERRFPTGLRLNLDLLLREFKRLLVVLGFLLRLIELGLRLDRLAVRGDLRVDLRRRVRPPLLQRELVLVSFDRDLVLRRLDPVFLSRRELLLDLRDGAIVRDGFLVLLGVERALFRRCRRFLERDLGVESIHLREQSQLLGRRFIRARSGRRRLRFRAGFVGRGLRCVTLLLQNGDFFLGSGLDVRAPAVEILLQVDLAAVVIGFVLLRAFREVRVKELDLVLELLLRESELRLRRGIDSTVS